MKAYLQIVIGILVAVLIGATRMAQGDVNERLVSSAMPTVSLGFDSTLVGEECSVDCVATLDGETGPCVSNWPPSYHVAPSAENEGGTVPPGIHNELGAGDHDEDCVIGACVSGFTWQDTIYIPAKHPTCIAGSELSDPEELLNALHVLGASARANDRDAVVMAAKVLEGRVRLAEAGAALEVLGCGGKLIAYIPISSKMKDDLTRPQRRNGTALRISWR